MNIKQEAKLHNKFDVTVCDAVTGEVKQKAVGYNVILDQYFRCKLGYKYSGDSYITSSLGKISVGTGTGTPAATDTALFTSLFTRAGELIEAVYAYPTSHVTYQIKINADEYNGRTFTEVGLNLDIGSPTKLASHAMLQDAEGNQIAIAKTDTDVVYIRATFYCTFTPGGWGDNGVYPTASQNILVKWLLGTSGYTVNLEVRSHRFPIQHSSDLNSDYEYAKTYSIKDSTGHIETMTLDLPEITILDTEFNTHVVKNIGITGFGAFQFPDASVFPDYTVTRLILGDGDGETTEYNIKCPCIKPGSVHIYVGDVEKTEGTDYILDLENNCNDAREHYYTANMNCKMANVSFGNINSLSPYTSSVYLDPLYWGRYRDAEYLYPREVTVSQAKPIWIDFGEAKECNVLRIDQSQIAAATLEAIRIEYSNDNVNWTPVVYTREQAQATIYNYKWKWNAVSARYWRVYSAGYNWTYRLYYYNSSTGTRDGTTHIKSSFFLGRSVPGLTFTTPPAAEAPVEASYLLNIPFKTPNNLMRIACSVQLQRG